MNADLDNDIDRLYAAPRDQFVRDRNALARKLRQSGDKTTASEVAALRKPTLVAWTVNQLAHTKRRDVDLLLDAGKRIIDAQQASISTGGRSELDAAQTSLRKAVNGLTEAAGAILGPDAGKATLTRIAETLRTAATAATGRELLARGRLETELSETGWEIVAAFTPAPRGKSRPDPDDTAAAGREAAAPSPAAEIKAQTKRLRDLKKSYAAAERRRRDARSKEQRAADHLEELRDARSKADAELEALDNEIASVEQHLAELRHDGNAT